MPKRIIQDVVERAPSSYHPKVECEEEVAGSRGPKRRWTSVWLVLGGSVIVLAVFWVLSSYFSKVLVKVETTKRVISLNETIILNKEGANGGVRYDSMKFKDTESAMLPTTGTKNVQRMATGKVTIYNAYSSTSQKLVAGTRLESKDGKIFKIDKAVTVPGLTIEVGKVVPGAIDVTVKASAAGASYNIPPSDFTIPGLKNTPKYQKFYAKSVQEFTGGYSGEIKVASAADIQKARVKLEESLRQKLTKNALVQVPKGMALYNDGIFFSASDNTVDGTALPGGTNGQVSLQVTGTLRALIINSDDLKKVILAKEVSGLGDAPVVLKGEEKIDFRIVNKEKVNPEGEGNVSAKLSGVLSVIWEFNENILKEKLVGMRKTKYQEVFSAFPVIEKAEAVFTPSWAFYFPSDASRITIDKGY